MLGNFFYCPKINGHNICLLSISHILNPLSYLPFLICRSFFLNRNYTTGCLTQCHSLDEVMNDTCSGAGCCETRIPEGLHFLSVTAGSIFNFKRTSQEFTLCSSAFVVATDSFKFTAADLIMSFDQMPKMLPVIYDWSIGNKTCTDAQTNGECLCCDGHGSECQDVQVQLGGYRCSCSPGYSGNPYLDHGCQGTYCGLLLRSLQ